MSKPLPAPGDLAGILRTCVQCGLCLPHCATFLATGNEVQSPRGRLVLLEGLLASAAAGADDAPDAFLDAFDQCIGCRACESVCPSGVPYTLLAHGHELADRRAGRAAEPAVPGPLLRRL
ncbi:4Fe-4S dicluster domain-containing protein, partial [bacterium]|nr:4Fe-4S dicluster domain-containing protein [bacterium]